MQAKPQLRRDEGHGRQQRQDEHDLRKALRPARQLLAPARRQQHGRDHGQHQRPLRHVRLVPGEQHERRRHQGRDLAETDHEQEHDQGRDEHVHQVPAIQPRRRRAIGTGGGDQLEPGRHAERGLHRLERLLPAGRRQHIALRLQTRGGAQIQITRTQLDAAEARMAALGDQHRFAVLGGAHCPERRCQIEAPVTQHAPADLVARGVAITVVVEPQRTAQVQAVLVLLRQSARALGNAQALARIECERRQVAPVLRHFGQRRIDLRRAFGFGDAQLRLRAIAPDLGFRPRRRQGAGLHRGQRRFGACDQRQPVLTGTHLQGQRTVAIEARIQITGQGHRDEAFGQGLGQLLLATLAGNGDLEACLQTRWHAVFEQAEDIDREAVALGHRGTDATEPQRVVVALHEGLRHCIEAERDARDRRRQCDRLRALVPLETTFDAVLARCQPDHRHAVLVRDHGQAAAVAAHVLRPEIDVARQRHRRPRMHGHRQAEAGAIVARRELQFARPQTGMRRVLVIGAGQARTRRRLVALERPADPVAQGLGHRRIRHCRQRGKSQACKQDATAQD